MTEEPGKYISWDGYQLLLVPYYTKSGERTAYFRKNVELPGS